MLEIFSKAKDSLYANTSYPLDKSNWSEYKSEKDILFDNENELSFYIHIPFCDKLCSFCEYVKFKKDKTYEQKYIDILENDINIFLEKHNELTLHGFDIGGGTPTVLEIENFKKLMDISKKINNIKSKVQDYEPSIEATFATLTEEKVKLISNAGFKRISLGIQTTNTKILNSQNRNAITLSKMIGVFDVIRKNGIKKINVDFMYGIFGQKIEDLKASLECLKILKPEHVTLYEMRYNLLKTQKFIDKEDLFNQYKFLYESLIKMGYIGEFGQNTFSLNDEDLGLSSYLRYRMIHNVSYKGFGIAAQSKSKIGISYNIGKNHEDIDTCFKNDTFLATDIYILPKEELVAKYIMISLYYGEFDLNSISKILGKDANEFYNTELTFLIENKYIKIQNNKVRLTEKGFKYYGAIGALFYSKKAKKWLMGD